MSKYTKGKWEVIHTGENEWAVVSGDMVLARLRRKDHPEWNEPNARRICECVNGWDELKAQRDALLEAAEKLIKKQNDDSIFRFPDNCEEIKNLKAAIAQAK